MPPRRRLRAVGWTQPGQLATMPTFPGAARGSGRSFAADPGWAVKRTFLAFLRNPYVQIVFKYGLGILLLAWVIGAYWDQQQDGQQVGLSAVLERPVSWS